MTPRKGHKVTVIKDGKAITLPNFGEAVRMTGVSKDTIKTRVKDGSNTRGWRFKEESK